MTVMDPTMSEHGFSVSRYRHLVMESSDPRTRKKEAKSPQKQNEDRPIKDLL